MDVKTKDQLTIYQYSMAIQITMILNINVGFHPNFEA
jgi:hypothetical protein